MDKNKQIDETGRKTTIRKEIQEHMWGKEQKQKHIVIGNARIIE